MSDIMIEAGLVLEGGGMRGLYTAGVLDYFVDKGLYFRNCYGVSAGATQCCSYLSKQKGRAMRINTKYMGDKRYASIRNLVRDGFYFGKEFTLKTIPNQLEPFDFDTYINTGATFYAVATDCKTGEPAYLKVGDMRKEVEMDKLWASCSLPLLSKMVEIEGKKYLDGGVSDSIPFIKAIEDGNEKVVVVCTRDINYRKSPNSMLPLIKIKYRKYPKLVEAMRVRHERYNADVEKLRQLESEGKVFVIRPKTKVEIGRLEKDASKMMALYECGYKEAEGYFSDLRKYLELE